MGEDDAAPTRRDSSRQARRIPMGSEAMARLTEVVGGCGQHEDMEQPGTGRAFFDRRGAHVTADHAHELLADEAYRVVARDQVGRWEVLTTWVGLDRTGSSSERPLIFATAAVDESGQGLTDEEVLAANEEEALVNHRRLLQQVVQREIDVGIGSMDLAGRLLARGISEVSEADAEGRVIRRPLRYATAAETAEAIRDAGDDEAEAWRWLCAGRDHLRELLERHEPESWRAAPPSTGSPELDLLLSALAAREFQESGNPVPAWCANREPLPQPWMPRHPFLPRERVLLELSAYLARFNIFVPSRDLDTALSGRHAAGPAVPRLDVDLTVFGASPLIETRLPRAMLGVLGEGDVVLVGGDEAPVRVFRVEQLLEEGRVVRLRAVELP